MRLLDAAPAPLCPRCGRILKPDVVMFGGASAFGCDGARLPARRRGTPAPRRRLVARGVSGRRPAARDAGRGRQPGDREPGGDPARRACLREDRGRRGGDAARARGRVTRARVATSRRSPHGSGRSTAARRA